VLSVCGDEPIPSHQNTKPRLKSTAVFPQEKPNQAIAENTC